MILQKRDVDDVRMKNIPIKNYKIISFDIFDTLITRSVAHPFGVFYLMQKKLRIDQIFDKEFIDCFVQNRIEAEGKAKDRYNKNQADFKEIYQFICGDYGGIEETHQNELMRLEFETELNVIQPIEAMVECLQKARQESCKVVFVTDMYLNTKYIQRILEHLGIYKDKDIIYSSSDLNMTKASGDLFKYVLKNEACEKKDIIHIGNNYDIDILPAQHCGFATYYYSDADNTKYENLLSFGAGQKSVTSPFFQKIAGASRLARIHNRYTTEEEKVYADLGANVAGPILYAFVAWILGKAKEEKLDRLYFVARDGQILFELAKQIKPFFYPGVELKYIYGSRQSWHLPSIVSIDTYALSWLLDQQPFLTLRAFSKRIKLDCHTVQYLFNSYFKCNVYLDKPLTGNEIESLRQLILFSELSDMILESASNERQKTLAYFAQEGLIEEKSAYGIVDLGWAGRLQQSLVTIIATTGINVTMSGFYFGLTRELESKFGKAYCYFFGKDIDPIFVDTGLKFLCILEVFTTADHASTTSFFEIDGEYKPVFAKLLYDKNTMDWISALRKGMYTFVSKMDQSLHHESFLNTLAFKERLSLIMNTLYSSPSSAEAENLGRFPYCTDQAESFYKDLAPKFKKLEAVRFLFVRPNRSKNLTSHWVTGSRIRSGQTVSKILSPRLFHIRSKLYHLIRRIIGLLKKI